MNQITADPTLLCDCTLGWNRWHWMDFPQIHLKILSSQVHCRGSTPGAVRQTWKTQVRWNFTELWTLLTCFICGKWPSNCVIISEIFWQKYVWISRISLSIWCKGQYSVNLCYYGNQIRTGRCSVEIERFITNRQEPWPIRFCFVSDPSFLRSVFLVQLWWRRHLFIFNSSILYSQG